jgi:hypothetical protein
VVIASSGRCIREATQLPRRRDGRSQAPSDAKRRRRNRTRRPDFQLSNRLNPVAARGRPSCSEPKPSVHVRAHCSPSVKLRTGNGRACLSSPLGKQRRLPSLGGGRRLFFSGAAAVALSILRGEMPIYDRDPRIDWYLRDPAEPPLACECPSWVPVEDADGLVLCVRCGKRGRRDIIAGQLEHALRERRAAQSEARPSRFWPSGWTRLKLSSPESSDLKHTCWEVGPFGAPLRSAPLVPTMGSVFEVHPDTGLRPCARR